MGNTGGQDGAETKCLNSYYYTYLNQTDYDPITADGILDACSQRHSVLVAGYIMIIFLALLLVPLSFITFKV